MGMFSLPGGYVSTTAENHVLLYRFCVIYLFLAPDQLFQFAVPLQGLGGSTSPSQLEMASGIPSCCFNMVIDNWSLWF